MTKTITVKGVGKASASPDLVVLTMALQSKNKDYEKAMRLASESIAQLNESLEAVGFERKSLKTTAFNVYSDYRRKKDGSGESVFAGYIISHDLKLEFALDPERLAKALSVVGNCASRPRISVAFTVKDTSAINDEMLRSAAENAKRKAEILCSASGKELGELLSIDYNWGEFNFYSDTRYALAEDCMVAASPKSSIDFEPDDIEVSDTVTFIWEIK